jgi:hypothetical protein
MSAATRAGPKAEGREDNAHPGVAFFARRPEHQGDRPAAVHQFAATFLQTQPGQRRLGDLVTGAGLGET